MPLYGELPQVTLPSGDVVNGFTVRIPSPEKTAVLRLPTAKEFLTYLQKSLNRSNKKVSSLQGTDELEVFNLIRLDKGEEFDEFEAEYIIGKIFVSDVFVTSGEKVGDTYHVRLHTGFGESVHVFRMPSLKELNQYRKAATPKVADWFDNPTVDLYDKLIKRTEGYAEGYEPADMPPFHKLLTVRETVAYYDTFDPLIPN